MKITNNFAHLERHQQTTTHIKIVEEKNQHISIEDFCSTDATNKSFREQVHDAEIKLVLFCIIHNLPLSLMDFLPNALKSIFLDSKIAQAIHCGKTKTTNLAKSLAQERQSDIAKMLKDKYFSLIVDETTDISTEKSLAVVVRIYDSLQNRVRDLFVGLIQLVKSDSETVYTSLVSFFNKLGVPTSNIIGLATDGASVMSGHLTGLQARFKALNPNMFYIRCICHSLHLCASYACKTLPNSVELLPRNIYTFFNHSSKRLHEFKEFQDYFSIKPHKILYPSQTRWLSLEKVVNRR